jgi:hypothetical protein
MQLPIKCPICQDVMLTEFTGQAITIKTCSKKLSHRIRFIASIKDYETSGIDLQITRDPGVWASWDLEAEELVIANEMNIIHLPYFYPDCSNHNKLIDKLKTYLVFS